MSARSVVKIVKWGNLYKILGNGAAYHKTPRVVAYPHLTVRGTWDCFRATRVLVLLGPPPVSVLHWVVLPETPCGNGCRIETSMGQRAASRMRGSSFASQRGAVPPFPLLLFCALGIEARGRVVWVQKSPASSSTANRASWVLVIFGPAGAGLATGRTE